MFETILVPTDGSEHARRAAEHAFDVARTFDATVRVLGVVDLNEAAGPFDAGGVSQEFIDDVKADSEDDVAEIAELADGVAVETHVETGQPRKEILSDAEEIGADLIAMGTHGRSGVRRLITGSVAEHVVRRADAPVLTARAADESVETEYEHILLPTDGSECAAEAIRHGVALAAAYDATLHAVYVVTVQVTTSRADAAITADLIEHYESIGEGATESVADAARDAGVDVVTAVEAGSPTDTVLTYADDHDVDIVTMGTHGRTGLQRVILGSTTEQTIRKSPVPVLSVRPAESSDE